MRFAPSRRKKPAAAQRASPRWHAAAPAPQRQAAGGREVERLLGYAFHKNRMGMPKATGVCQIVEAGPSAGSQAV